MRTRVKKVLLILLLAVTARLAKDNFCEKIRHNRVVRQPGGVSTTILDRKHFFEILRGFQLKPSNIRLTRVTGRRHLYKTSEPTQCDLLACSRPHIDREVKSVQRSLQRKQFAIFGDTISSTSCHLRYNNYDLKRCRNILRSAFKESDPSTAEFWKQVTALEPGTWAHIVLYRSESEYVLLMRSSDADSLGDSSVCRCPNSAETLLKRERRNYDLSAHITEHGVNFISNLFEFETSSFLAEFEAVCLGSSHSATNQKIFEQLKPCMVVLDSEKAEVLRKANRLSCPMYKTLIDSDLCELVQSVTGPRRTRSFIGRAVSSVFDIVDKDEMEMEFANTRRITTDLNDAKHDLNWAGDALLALSKGQKDIVADFIRASETQFNATRDSKNNTKVMYRLWAESMATQKVVHRSESLNAIREALHSVWSGLSRTISVLHTEAEHISIEQIRPGLLLLIKPQAKFSQRTFIQMNCVPEQTKLGIPDIMRYFPDNGDHVTFSNKVYSQDLVRLCVGNIDAKEEGDCSQLMVPVPTEHISIHTNSTALIIFTGKDTRCKVNKREVALKRGFHFYPLRQINLVVCGDQVKVLNVSAVRLEDEELLDDVESLHLAIITPDQHNVSAYVDKILNKLNLDPVKQAKIHVKLTEIENRTRHLVDTVVHNPIHRYSWILALVGACIVFSPFCCCLFCCDCCKPIKRALACLVCGYSNKCGHYGAVATQRRQDRKWKKIANVWLSGVQRLRVLEEQDKVEEIFNLCEDSTNPDLNTLFADPIIADKPTVAMVCLLLLKAQSALADLKDPIEVEKFKLLHKATVLSVGHCDSGYVSKEVITAEYIIHSFTDIITTSTDIGSLSFPDGSNNIRGFLTEYRHSVASVFP